MPKSVNPFSQVAFADAREGDSGLERLSREDTPYWRVPYLQSQSQHRVRAAPKSVEALPPLLQTVIPLEGCHDELVIDELWTFLGTKACDSESARSLWEQVPSPWRNGLVFTDGLRLYQTLFQDTPLKHCRCIKTDKSTWGETSIVEGANNALRQGVSYLGRKTQAFARSHDWLQTRLH